MSVVLKSFNVSDITFKKPEKIGKHSYVYKLHYQKKRKIIFQTPKLHIPYIPSVYRHKNYVFYKLGLEADRLKYDSEVKSFLRQLESIDRHIKSRAGTLWEKIGYSRRNKKFKNSVLYNSDKTKGFLYMNIQVYQKQPVLSVFDCNKDVQNYEYLIPGSRAYSLIWLDNVWMKSNQMGLNWVIVQMKVYLPIFKIDTCLIDESIDSKEDEDAVKKAQQTPSQGTTLGTHPSYQKYFKMKRMGVPIMSIQHKLKMDGLDEQIILKNEEDAVPVSDTIKCALKPSQQQKSGGGLMNVLKGLGSVKLKKTKQNKKLKTSLVKPRDNRIPSLEEILTQLKNLKKTNQSLV